MREITRRTSMWGVVESQYHCALYSMCQKTHDVNSRTICYECIMLIA